MGGGATLAGGRWVHLSDGTVWTRHGYPALQLNANISRILWVNSVTGGERLLWSRAEVSFCFQVKCTIPLFAHSVMQGPNPDLTVVAKWRTNWFLPAPQSPTLRQAYASDNHSVVIIWHWQLLAVLKYHIQETARIHHCFLRREDPLVMVKLTAPIPSREEASSNGKEKTTSRECPGGKNHP